MRDIWVDTDFGFDDLWALLLLRAHGCPVAGVSLVAGNAPLAQVAENARRAKAAYRFDWPVWQGSMRPLIREPETAQHVLGQNGMRSRGAYLPETEAPLPEPHAVEALRDWLASGPDGPRDVLALGPLTNIARLFQNSPEAVDRITRLVWMGGSCGPGNHTAMAEFNAVADAEALAVVAESDVKLDIVDLMFCRHVTFGEENMPQMDPLTSDLLGGYLDIALDRGRHSMAIYDPLAALALADAAAISFSPCKLEVSTIGDEVLRRHTDDENGRCSHSDGARARGRACGHLPAGAERGGCAWRAIATSTHQTFANALSRRRRASRRLTF